MFAIFSGSQHQRCWGKTRLESSIKKLKPHLMYDCFAGFAARAVSSLTSPTPKHAKDSSPSAYSTAVSKLFCGGHDYFFVFASATPVANVVHLMSDEPPNESSQTDMKEGCDIYSI